MNRYRMHQDTTSRYASMNLCSEGEFVEVEDVKALLDKLFEEKMIDNQYDLLDREGLITPL